LCYACFAGTIPSFTGNNQLTALNLNGNRLTGAMPDLSSLPRLRKLDLSGNQLSSVDVRHHLPPAIVDLQLGSNPIAASLDIETACTAPNNTHLLTLNVSDVGLTALDHTVVAFAVGCFPNLVNLDLSFN